ncbi:MAG: response regulator [Acidobacteriota bacterium]|nr:response regulator [Acidobacteriota bacterium]
MDAMNAGMVALTFIGAQVAQKAANGAIEAIWTKFSDRFLVAFNEPPNADALIDLAPEVLANDPELSQEIEAVFGSSIPLRRAQLVAPALRHARLLWIDDNPGNNEWERLTLRQLGAQVTAVRNTETAIECLQTEPFDLIISDISRPGGVREGINALTRLEAAAPGTAVVFYVGRVDPASGVPPGAFGITNTPGELLHLVMDALERCRL